MTEQFVREVLFPVIRSGMGLETPAISLSAEELKELEAIGDQQAILPIIGEGLKKLGLLPERKQALRNRLMGYVYRYVVRANSLCQIGEALSRIDVPYVFLKGSVLQHLYPEAWMRSSCDIDVLVREEDLEKAVAVIEKETEFEFNKRNYHDVAMLSKRLCLELHFSVKEKMANIDSLLSHVWEYAVPTDDGKRYELTPEFQVFHNLAHMSYHMVHGGLGIRPFLDVWLLSEKTQFDETVVRQMCGECGILRFYEVVCDMVNVWMNDLAHTDVTRVLEQFCLNGGVFGTIENGAAMRKRRGWAYLWSRLFVEKSVLEERYQALRGHPYLVPFYQARRWLRLMDPEVREKVISEFKLVRTIPKETIDSFDQLLTSMGL